jgi:very-short-patch-repair endonuclease
MVFGKDQKMYGKDNPFYGKHHTKSTKNVLRAYTLKQFSDGMPAETRIKISNSCIGKKQLDETKLKISQYRTGKTMSSQQKEKIRKAVIKNMNDGKVNTRDTSIEKLIENKLLFNNITYIKQYPYELGVADFWLPEYNIIIECDGDYWHSLPHIKTKDVKKTEWLQDNEYLVYRLSEKAILSNSPIIQELFNSLN